jgi:hypothetical protein
VGISTLPTNYSGYIENFLTEYLGTADRPTPFGGRAEALHVLDEWLNDSEYTHKRDEIELIY